MTASEFDSFRVAFESTDFFSLADEYYYPPGVADDFYYTIICNVNDTSKTVKTQGWASKPAGLGNFLNVMWNANSLIKSKGQGD